MKDMPFPGDWGTGLVRPSTSDGAQRLRSTAIAVVECGRIAQRLGETADGAVCAVFRRSYYLEFPGQRVLCVGDRSLGRGPLNVRLERFESQRIGAVLMLNLGGATLWQPSTRLGSPQRAAIDMLRATARDRIPADGLGALVCDGSNALIEHARQALVALGRWLAGGRLGDEVESLLGLGPGLTPSGDDYLGGIMIALRAFGCAPDADALWSWLAPRAAARTSLISAAHLAAAAEGEGHETLHDCLEAIADGATPGWDARLTRLASVGHCSGWDGLAGVLAVAQRAVT